MDMSDNLKQEQIQTIKRNSDSVYRLAYAQMKNKSDKEDLSYTLKKLSKKYNAVLHLFYYEDMTTREIADAMHIKEGNVRMLLTRARRALKEILEKEYPT